MGDGSPCFDEKPFVGFISTFALSFCFGLQPLISASLARFEGKKPLRRKTNMEKQCLLLKK